MFVKNKVNSFPNILFSYHTDQELREAPTKADMQLTLAEREMAQGLPSGCAAWLSFGLTIEEQQ